MAQRLLLSLLISAPLLVPIAVFLQYDVAVEQDSFDESSLLQTGSALAPEKGSHKAAVHASSGRATLKSKDDAGIDLQAGLAEFVAMTLFVIIGCGSAMGIANKEGYAWVLQVSLTFGIAITVLAYSIGHISGGQINCAVTLGLVIVGNITYQQGLVNLGFQLLGSIVGAIILSVVYPPEKDLTGNLGSNGIGEGFTKVNALAGEIVGTFLLMFVVLQTAINPATAANSQMACLAIGFAVFLAHSVLIPIDGCSINPTRSFGPAIVAACRGLSKDNAVFKDMWVFWAGPLIGAAIAAVSYNFGFGYEAVAPA